MKEANIIRIGTQYISRPNSRTKNNTNIREFDNHLFKQSDFSDENAKRKSDGIHAELRAL